MNNNDYTHHSDLSIGKQISAKTRQRDLLAEQIVNLKAEQERREAAKPKVGDCYYRPNSPFIRSYIATKVHGDRVDFTVYFNHGPATTTATWGCDAIADELVKFERNAS